MWIYIQNIWKALSICKNTRYVCLSDSHVFDGFTFSESQWSYRKIELETQTSILEFQCSFRKVELETQTIILEFQCSFRKIELETQTSIL